MLWDGNPASLTAKQPTSLTSSMLTQRIGHQTRQWRRQQPTALWTIDPSDPDSPVRCEIVPEMDTGASELVTVTNRSLVPWTIEPVAVQLDKDKNGIFSSGGEISLPKSRIAWTLKPTESRCKALTMRPNVKQRVYEYNYNFTWESQYSSGTYGMRVDFTNSGIINMKLFLFGYYRRLHQCNS